MWVLQAVLVGGLVVASVVARRGAKRLERVVEDLELERAVFLGILGIARRLVSRYEPLEALVDEVPYGCIDCGMQVVDGEGASSGPSSSRPPHSTELAGHAGERKRTMWITSRWLPSQLLVADAAASSSTPATTLPVARSTRRRLRRLVVPARAGKRRHPEPLRSHGRSPHRTRGGMMVDAALSPETAHTSWGTSSSGKPTGRFGLSTHSPQLRPCRY